ncbi:2-methylcitrate dehydratase PrpD [Pseudorhizobium tarimense]|uniref:2-methylcitrate dehydratase PrpD n=1 Tax=Pseudorhizobium tarimense TaxID=1079109 RepID=A0ABV2HC91_9HYPH|nr:MmgE/PrpD family protein [Pseudorhizobium tarimense]MCJ8521143.1 MmgE/PrpD family protein [Pseudorhizobium tarimense]
MEVVEQLAKHITSGTFLAAPQEVRDRASCCIVDAVTAAVTGHDTLAARASRSVAAGMFSNGASPVWFSNLRLNPIGAAFSNSAAMSALDFDDGHRKARGHPGAAVIPAALTQGGDGRAPSPESLIAAVIAGYEMSVRIAAAQNPLNISTHQSGRWTAFGAVAAAASIRGCDASTTASAMAIAGCWSPNQQPNGSSGYSRQTGNHAKEGIPWSVVTGLTALDLATAGFTGPGDLLDHPDFYDPSTILDGLGERWDLLGVYFKPYSCCRYIHPAIDAVITLMQSVALQTAEIRAVRVRTFGWATRLQNSYTPSNLVEIQYSLPFCVAAAVCRGVQALSPVDDSLLVDAEVASFATRITLEADPQIDRRFPAETLAQVIIETDAGPISSGVVSPRGDAGIPWVGRT